MLILSRKTGESIIIDGRILVKIVRIEGGMVKVGIEAPSDVPVHRQEVFDEIQRNNQEALTRTRPALPKFAPIGSGDQTKGPNSPANPKASPANKSVLPASDADRSPKGTSSLAARTSPPGQENPEPANVKTKS